MQYARIGGELHVHEDRVKIYDASGKELNLWLGIPNKKRGQNKNSTPF